MATKKLLYEVSVIRPLVIFLLVVMHSFTIYAGGWESVNNVDIPAYNFFVKLISGFRIETIALIAGYVFAFQSIELNRHYSFKSFAWKKFKRLLLPCYFFGVLYFFIFLFQQDSFSIVGFIRKVLDGTGHLWFLPMLFWCFLGLWLLERLKINKTLLLVLLFGLSVLPIPYIPLGLSNAPRFLFFCYGGYMLYKYKNTILSKLLNWKTITLFLLLYGGLLCLKLAFNQRFMASSWGEADLIYKAIVLLTSNVLRGLTCVAGIMALYLIVCRFTERDSFKPKNWVIWSSTICYGVYVYHQFFLQYLYYKTSLPQLVDAYSLPWIALIITLTLSIGLTVVSLKTKFGRFLIG